MQQEVNEFLAYVKREMARGVGDWEQRLTTALVKHAGERGLVLLSCGLYGNVIRFLAPLTASDAIVQEGLGIVIEALRELTVAADRKAVNS